MDWQLIESDEALQQKLLQVDSSDVVIVDTEFMRRNTFYPQVALVQLCFVNDSTGHETAWLIDPLCIKDTAPLVALLTDPNVLKVMHSASEDLEVFHHWLGVVPQPLFDTQRAAALLDRGFGLGYRALVQEICDIDLPKGETQSNWLQRPLTESQCEYAGLDVTWLLRVWQDLYAQCMKEEKLDWVLSDGVDAMNGLASTKMATHKRIKTAFKLNSRELGALVAICEWREETARRRDKPRNWIIDDKTCLQLAQRDPRSVTELQADLELPAPVLRRHSAELLELLARQRDVPAAELPPRLPAPLDGAQRSQLKKLKAEARSVAEQLGVAPEVLLQSKDYELLLRETGGESIDFPPAWLGWRNESVLAPLRQYLAGRG